MEAILTEFLSPEEIAARPLDQLIDILVEKGRSRFTDPEATAKELKATASKAYKLHASLLEPVNLILATSLQTIRTLEQQVKSIDKAIEKELSHFPNTLQSMPGIGPVCAAGMVAEIGDIHRFDDEKALAKFAGLTWNRYSACQIIPFFFYLLMIKLTLIFYGLDTRAVALDRLPQGHNRPISPDLELVYRNYWGKGVVR